MIRAKKHFGQNFLQDESVLNKIIQAISKETSLIVEIGIGLGDLTRLLLQKAPVRAFEIDEELVNLALNSFQKELETKNLTLIKADASKSEFWADEPYVLVANLPYYIATNLILKALEDELCQGFVVMIQKEVAQKFCARTGQSDFCALSVLASIFGECEFLFEVAAECFKPQPKVTSAVIRLEKRQDKSKFLRESGFKLFLKDCFKAPRKQLLSAFSGDKNKLRASFEKYGIAQNARAHQISVESYLKFYEDIKDDYERRAKRAESKF